MTHCACCGRPRGDGRRDRGWKYIFAPWPGTKLELRVAYCSGCAQRIDAEATRRAA